MVVVANPQLAKQIFTTSPDVLGNIRPNLSRLLGSGSVFALDGEEHRQRRRLLAPPFHGKSIKNYENIIEEETLREIAGWPEGTTFATLPSTMRITLNAILRAVFGAEGAELDRATRDPAAVGHLGLTAGGSAETEADLWPLFPMGHDWSSGGAGTTSSSTSSSPTELADPNLEARTDVLALMLRSTYEDGSTMSRNDIGDELLTLLAAGHETTAATLGWAFERVSRHPDVLAALVAEADAQGNELRQATILEVQRSRTVIDFAGRHVYAPVYQLGEWAIPRGYVDPRQHRPHARRP